MILAFFQYMRTRGQSLAVYWRGGGFADAVNDGGGLYSRFHRRYLHLTGLAVGERAGDTRRWVTIGLLGVIVLLSAMIASWPSGRYVSRNYP